jgi:outer membrane receptor for ferrienterochelin and colicins
MMQQLMMTKRSIVLMGLFSLQSFAASLYFDPSEIVVTGSRNEEALSDTAVKTEVISREFIKQNNLKSLTEVVERIPGVVLEENTGRSGVSAVMQGLGQDQVLIMIDGIPQLQTTSSGFDLTQLTTSEIEKVEVTKGGASALYGSHAIGGVINIITKSDAGFRKAKVFFDSLVGMSDDQERPNTHIGVGVNLPITKKLSSRFAVSRNDRQSTDLDEGSLNRDSPDNEAVNIKANLRYQEDKSNFVRASYREQRQRTLNIDSIRTLSGRLSRRDNRGELKNGIGTLQFAKSLGEDNVFKANIQYEKTREELDLLNNPDLPQEYRIIDLSQEGLRSELVWNSWSIAKTNLTSGIVFQQEKLQQLSRVGQSDGSAEVTKDIYDKDRETLDLFTQAEFFLGESLEVSRFANSFNPKINAKYSLGKLSSWKVNFRGSVGSGYRTPSLKENYYVLDHRSIGNYIIKGNEELVPERSVSYQLGFEVIKGEALSLYANGFINKVDNLIDRIELAPIGGTRQLRFINFDQVESRGIEFSLKTQNTYRLSTGFDYTYTQTINERTDLLMPNRPRSIFNLNARYAFTDKLSMLTNIRFIGDQFADVENEFVSREYSTVDLKLNINLTSKATLNIGLNNIFDVTRRGLSDGETQDEEIRDARPILGRYAYLGVVFEG